MGGNCTLKKILIFALLVTCLLSNAIIFAQPSERILGMTTDRWSELLQLAPDITNPEGFKEKLKEAEKAYYNDQMIARPASPVKPAVRTYKKAKNPLSEAPQQTITASVVKKIEINQTQAIQLINLSQYLASKKRYSADDIANIMVYAIATENKGAMYADVEDHIRASVRANRQGVLIVEDLKRLSSRHDKAN